MDREGAQRWLDRYVAAWRSYDRDEIAGLFADDVAYRYHPFAPVAVDGDTVVATGRSTYREAPQGPVTEIFDNCFVIRFDAAGRCREFTEYYIKQPKTV